MKTFTKKLITLASLGTSAVLAIALANAEDRSTTTETSETVVKSSESTPNSCTDKKGVTHYEGRKGYKECMRDMGKTGHSEQMGGRADTSRPSTMESPTPDSNQ